MPGHGSTSQDLYGSGIGLVYQSEPKLGSGPDSVYEGPVYESEPKINSRLNFLRVRTFR